MSDIQIQRADGPLVLGLPHTGTDVPADVAGALNETGHALADTDWHIHHLYDGLIDAVTTVRTPVHRYVIDVNRDPEGQSLYPGQNTTGLCPATDFDGQPIYVEGRAPDAAETQKRLEAYHRPYHTALGEWLDRMNPELILSIHSFTPKLATSQEQRPWEVALLYNQDDRAARHAIRFFGELGYNVGDNEPYSGRELNATMNRHAEAHGRAYCAIEIRQDLISNRADQARWAATIADVAGRVALALS